LGMFSDNPDKAKHGYLLGTGMHGGVIYVRGGVDESRLATKEVGVFELDDDDQIALEGYIAEYGADFGIDPQEILKEQFVKILPRSARPYGNMYCPMPR